MEILYVVVGLAAAAGAGCGALWWVRNRKPKEELVYYYRCEGCKRKMRYLARQANSRGMCPMCKRKFVFPAVSQKA